MKNKNTFLSQLIGAALIAGCFGFIAILNDKTSAITYFGTIGVIASVFGAVWTKIQAQQSEIEELKKLFQKQQNS